MPSVIPHCNLCWSKVQGSKWTDNSQLEMALGHDLVLMKKERYFWMQNFVFVQHRSLRELGTVQLFSQCTGKRRQAQPPGWRFDFSPPVSAEAFWTSEVTMNDYVAQMIEIFHWSASAVIFREFYACWFHPDNYKGYLVGRVNPKGFPCESLCYWVYLILNRKSCWWHSPSILFWCCICGQIQ